MINRLIRSPTQKICSKIINQCFSVQKRLFVYDGNRQNRQEFSGIRATIFGATGLVGKYVGTTLGEIGSELIFPYNIQYKPWHSDDIKELKLCAGTSKSYLHPQMNFKDQNMIENMIGNSNVVINLLGPRKYCRRKEQFQYINIEAAQRIATACNKKGVHRLIHFSAAGAQLNSPSQDFHTKAIGQKRVLQIFPRATIFRPCPIFGMNDYFASIIQRQNNFFFNAFTIVSDDCTALKQPIAVTDIAQCVLNAIKLQNTKGRIFELGGPNVLSYLDIYEIMYNYMKIKPRLAYINPAILKAIASKIYNWQFLSGQMITKRIINEVVKKSETVGTIDDLYVKPVTFKNGIQSMFQDRVAIFTQRQEDLHA